VNLENPNIVHNKMSKKKYYTYISTIASSTGEIKTNNPYMGYNIKFHKDHASVLDVSFKVGDLVETYNGDLGVIVKTLSEVSEDEMQNLPTIMYEVQVGPTTEYWMGISLKKIKNKKKFDK